VAPPRSARRPPAERVRARLAEAAGPELAAAMPRGYQRLGRVLVLRLPDAFRPYFPLLGAAWQETLRVATVLVRTGPIAGDRRTPTVERIAGGPTETEVLEHGVRWRFDAARIMFAAGNRTERRRAGALVRPDERVVDLFAGIGYFSIPAALPGRARAVVAVDHNPLAIRYLTENAARNGVAERVVPVLGDNRTVDLAPASADRLFLGYLPSARPWIPRALALARPGAWIHVHSIEDARGAEARAVAATEAAVRAAGGSLRAPPRGRAVKPYGPGRTHVVVDARVDGPGARPGTMPGR